MPLFRAGKPRVGLRLTSALALPANTGVAVPWSSIYDEEGATLWNPGAPTDIVLSHTGLWIFAFACRVESAPGARVQVWVDAQVPGRFPAIQQLASNDVGEVWVTATGFVHVAAGTAVQCLAFQGGPGAGQVAANRAHVAVARIGPEKWT